MACEAAFLVTPKPGIPFTAAPIHHCNSQPRHPGCNLRAGLLVTNPCPGLALVWEIFIFWAPGCLGDAARYNERPEHCEFHAGSHAPVGTPPSKPMTGKFKWQFARQSSSLAREICTSPSAHVCPTQFLSNSFCLVKCVVW